MKYEIAPLENPRGDVEKANAIVGYINLRTFEYLDEIRALDAAITEANYNAPEIAARMDAISRGIEELRTAGKRLVETCVADAEAQRILTAIDKRLWNYSTRRDPASAYGRLADAYEAVAKRVKGYREANRPQAPVRAVAILLYATDEGVAKLAEKIRAGKVPGVTGYKFAPDEAAEKRAAKIIEG